MNVSSLRTTTRDDKGLVTTNDTDTIYPQLTLNAETMLYPKLRLDLGGTFDLNQSSLTSSGAKTDFSIARLRPFFQLRSTDQVLSPGIAYFRRDETTTGTGTPPLRLTSEDYSAYLGWRPAGGPQSDVQFVRTNTFADTRQLNDSTKDFGSIISRYNAKGLGVSYLGSYLDTNNRVAGADTRQVMNAVRLDESATFLKNRLNWSATYNINHQDLRTIATSTSGEVPIPLVAFVGLSAVSDTPLTASLAQTPALVDGSLTVAVGVNIGFPAFLGGDTRARNIGLDFSTPTAVNRLLIWVDRDLPAAVANSFSWEIYSSTDNVTWKRETSAITARFGPFETRFQIDFTTISARYVKAVTRPLSGAVVDATRYQDIFVTEVQGFLRRAAGDVQGIDANTFQLVNSDIRLRLLDTPRLYFENSYWYAGVMSRTRRDILSNGASIFQQFARIFSIQGRVAHETGTEPQGDRVALVGNASFTVTPVPAFTGSLLYSGLSETVAGRYDDRRTMFIQTNTHVYRGLDVQAGGGWTFTAADGGRNARDGLFNISASIVPRPGVTVSLNYADTTTRPTGPFAIEQVFRTRRGYATLAYDATRTLRLVVGEELLDVTGEKRRNTHNFAVDWSPFPDGALQVIVAYNEMLRDLQFGTEKTFRPGVRWTFSRQSYVDVSYQRIQSEYAYAKTDSNGVSLDLKLFVQ